MKPHTDKRQVLVIKLGAIGDFVQATGAFADIRAHEKIAEITLLTTPAMMALATRAAYFNRIEIDRRRPLWQVFYRADLVRRLRAGRFAMVYDLQANSRTARYWRMMGRPPWNGIVRGCSHPHTNPQRPRMHAVEIFRDQLNEIRITCTHSPDVSWAGDPLDAETEASLSSASGRRIALLPGSAPSRLEKRWPGFETLARQISARGDTGLLVGAAAEQDLLAKTAANTGAINLCGRLSLNQLVTLFAQVDLVIGNDTGPMHIAGAVGARGVTILGPASDAARHAPATPLIGRLETANLSALTASEVLRAADMAASAAEPSRPH